MIISASRRTDIPAYFPGWFIEQLKQGFVKVPNPFNPRQVSTVSLKPEDVDCFIFWTRNPKPFYKAIDILNREDYHYYFLFTLTPYGMPLEHNNLSLPEKIDAFKELANKIGPEKIVWRYDPIILSNITHFDYHLEKFGNLAGQLSNYTEEVKISFIDYYKKVQTPLKRLSDYCFIVHPEQEPGFNNFLKKMVNIAHQFELKITSCAEPVLQGISDIEAGSCVDINRINRLFKLNLVYKKDPSQRDSCLCAVSKDIGSYNTCRAGCQYCYAVGHKKSGA